jgi:hypothetical protein
MKRAAWYFLPLIAVELATGCDGKAPAADSWWTWGITFAQAAGTLGAVLVALFGKALQAKVFPPRLELTLRSREGELGEGRGTEGPRTYRIPERGYHLRVSSGRRWSPVHSVRVMLVRIERRSATGTYQKAWEGETPMRWQHQE